jgi:hypothetical protein
MMFQARLLESKSHAVSFVLLSMDALTEDRKRKTGLSGHLHLWQMM